MIVFWLFKQNAGCHLCYAYIVIWKSAQEPPKKNANGENEYTYKIQATQTVGSHGCGLLSQDKSMYVYFSYLKNTHLRSHTAGSCSRTVRISCTNPWAALSSIDLLMSDSWVNSFISLSCALSSLLM